MKRKLLTWAGLLLCAGGISTAQAMSTVITFSVDMATNLALHTFNPPPPAGTGTDQVSVFGTFNGWASPGLLLYQAGTSTVFTNSVTDTSDVNGVVSYRYMINGALEALSDYDNRASYVPTNLPSASISIPTPFYGGIGPTVSINVKFQVDMSEEILLGHFHPLTGDTLYVAGSFNGWGGALGNPLYQLTNDPTILITNVNFAGGLVTSNVYVRTIPITSYANTAAGTGSLPATNEDQEMKYVEMPASAWENPGPHNADDAGNRFFIDNTNQVLPIVNFSDQIPTPLANVTLSVDMSTVNRYDSNYIPKTVTVWGTFNNWAIGVDMTNNPSAANTNIYQGLITMGEATEITYQFRYTNSAVIASGVTGFPWVYDFIGDQYYGNVRRTLTLPITSTTLNTNIATVYFNDLAPTDVLAKDTPVHVSVDMNGAVGTDGHPYTLGDGIYVNGIFVNYGGYPGLDYAWVTGSNPVSAPPGYQLTQVGSSTVYGGTVVVPAGTPVAISYMYGMDPGGSIGGPVQDENANEAVRTIRVVRSTVFNPYVMSGDTWTTNAPYHEPLFSLSNMLGIGTTSGGNLQIGRASGGTIPVSWLGRPGAHLQFNTSLGNPVWQDALSTDGTTWSAGSSSTNGFISQTNWPSSGTTFFRLIKP